MNDHDGVGENPVRHSPLGTTVLAGLAVLGVLAYSWWAVGRTPFSGGATAAVVAGGGAAAVLGAVLPRRRGELHGGRGWLAWLALIAVASVWQAAAYLQHPRHDHPTLSSLVNAGLESHPARAAAFTLWLVATACLARR